MALRSVLDHPKLEDLRARLGLSRYEALGILEVLWHFTARYAPAGDVGKYKDAQLLAWIGWTKEGDLLDALVATGWLDRCRTHRLIVHHWHEHCDSQVHTELAKKTLRFAGNHLPKLDKTYFNSETRRRIKAEYEKKYPSGGDDGDNAPPMMPPTGDLSLDEGDKSTPIHIPHSTFPTPSHGGDTKTDDQTKARVLSERFDFFWTKLASRGRRPLSPIETASQFGEHLRRHPEHYEILMAEIENAGRDRNEWPDALIARVVRASSKPSISTAATLPNAADIHAAALAQFEAVKAQEAEGGPV